MDSTNLVSEEVAGGTSGSGGTMPDHLNSSTLGGIGQESQDGVDDDDETAKEEYWKKRFDQVTWDILRSSSSDMVDEIKAPFPIMRPQKPPNDKSSVERIPWTMNLPVMFPVKRVKGLLVRAPELIDIADDEDDDPIQLVPELIDVPDDDDISPDGFAVDIVNGGGGEDKFSSQEPPTSGPGPVVATSKSTNELTMFQHQFKIDSTLGHAVDIVNGGGGEEDSISQESPTTGSGPVVATSKSTNGLDELTGVTDDSILLNGLELDLDELDLQSDSKDPTDGMPHLHLFSDNPPSYDKKLDLPMPILQAADAEASTVTMVQHSAPEASIAEKMPSTSDVIIPSIKKAKLDNDNNGCPKNITRSSSIQQPNILPKAKLAALFKACQPKRKPKVRRGKKPRAASSIPKHQAEATTQQPETKETTNTPLLMSEPAPIQHVEVKVPLTRRQRRSRSCISPDVVTVTTTTPPPTKTQKPGKAPVQQSTSTSTFKDLKVAMMDYLQEMRTKPRQSLTVASFTSRAKGVAVRIGFDFQNLPADWIQELRNQYSDDFSNFGIDHLAAPPSVRASRKRK